jgi:hypothetical protein
MWAWAGMGADNAKKAAAAAAQISDLFIKFSSKKVLVHRNKC